MACENEMACCVRGHQVYKDIWAAAIGEVLVCSREPTNVGKIFVVKLYSRKKISDVFCVRKYFYNEKKKRITVALSLRYDTCDDTHSLTILPVGCMPNLEHI